MNCFAGQYLGAIAMDPTSAELFVTTYKQNSGARSVFRLPTVYPAAAGPNTVVGSEASWSLPTSARPEQNPRPALCELPLLIPQVNTLRPEIHGPHVRAILLSFTLFG